jgi:hypothetical protein
MSTDILINNRSNKMLYDRTKIPTPKTTYQAVKKKCLDCIAGERPRIKNCPIKDCIFWPHRFGMGPTAAAKKGHDVGDNTRRLTMKDLRAECVDCMGGGTEAYRDVRECKDTDCGLYPFRMGHR